VLEDFLTVPLLVKTINSCGGTLWYLSVHIVYVIFLYGLVLFLLANICTVLLFSSQPLEHNTLFKTVFSEVHFVLLSKTEYHM
jgi:hypothetical protein